MVSGLYGRDRCREAFNTNSIHGGTVDEMMVYSAETRSGVAMIPELQKDDRRHNEWNGEAGQRDTNEAIC